MDKTSKMNKLITIYTQAYNVEPYIEQCIKSVISQTYCNFEWLLIENGSTDGTKEIIRKYEQLDSRINRIRRGLQETILEKIQMVNTS